MTNLTDFEQAEAEISNYLEDMMEDDKLTFDIKNPDNWETLFNEELEDTLAEYWQDIEKITAIEWMEKHYPKKAILSFNK